MDTLKIADQITEKINELSKMRAEIRTRALNKAESKSNYERAVAITIVKLKNGIEFKLEDSSVVNPPTTIIEKIARGVCYKECLAMDEAEGLYKSLIVNIEAVKAELNGLQSINRHLDEH